MNRIFAAALIAASLAAPAFAGETDGTIVAYDRVAKVVVLDDMTIYSLQEGGYQAPAELSAGDEVTVDFVSTGEDGIDNISAITIRVDQP